MAKRRNSISTPDGERVFLGWRGLYSAVGDHIGHFYFDRSECLELALPFLKVGLDEGDKCVLLSSSEPGWSNLRPALEKAGADVKAALDSGQLVVASGESCAENQKAVLTEMIADTRRRFRLMRWVGDMTWALDKMPTTEELMRWESACNVVNEPPAVFLCQYDLKMFSGNVLFDALKTHPLCVIRDSIHRNPFYEDPEAYLAQLVDRQRAASPAP